MYVYSPGTRADNPLETNFWCQQTALITLPVCCRFKKKCFKVRFYIHFFFHVSPYVYSPGQGQTILLGQNFDVNRKALSLCLYVASFKMISSKFDFIHFFNDFIHVYSPGARAENPLATNVWCQQKALITSTICCNFQTNLFEFWFYTHFLMFFHMYIAPLKSDFIHNFHVFIHVYSPLGSEFLYKHKPFVTLVICCKFLPLNDFLTVFPI